MNLRPPLTCLWLLIGFLSLANCLNEPVSGGCWSVWSGALGSTTSRKNFIRDSLKDEKCVIVQPTILFSLINYGPKRAFCPPSVLDIARNRKTLNLSPNDELITNDYEDWFTYKITQSETCVSVDIKKNSKCSRQARQARSITTTNSTLLNKLIRPVRSSDSESDFDVSVPSDSNTDYDSDATIIIECSTDQRGKKRPYEDDTDTEDEEDVEPSNKRPKLGKVGPMLDAASNPAKVIPDYQAESGITDDQLAAYNPDKPELNNGGRFEGKEWQVDPVSFYILHSWNLDRTFETPTKLRPNKNAKWTSAGGDRVPGSQKAFDNFIDKQLQSGILSGLSAKAKASIAKGETFLLKRDGKTMSYTGINAFLNDKAYGSLMSAKVDRNTDPNKKRDMQPAGLGDYRELQDKINFYLQRLSNEFRDDVDILTQFVAESIERA